MKKITRYMHVMDGQPAEYQSGHLVYCGRYCGKLAKSLEQIKRERHASIEFFAAENGRDTSVYSHVRIRIE